MNINRDMLALDRELGDLLKRGVEIARAGDILQSTALLQHAYELAVKREDASSAAIALSNLSQQARLQNDLPASLTYAQQIFHLKGSNVGPIAFKGFLAVSHHYASIGCDAEVIALMLEAESSLSDASLSDVCHYFELRGTAEARVGNQTESTRAFDTLLDISERHDSSNDRIMRLSSAAFSAASQGLMGRAFGLNERAISVAKGETSAFGWSVSTLSYAWNALLAGDLSRSRSLAEAAELWPNGHLYVRLLRAAVGVLLGCLTNDRDLITRCLDLGVLELALVESSAYRAGPVAAAVHEYYTGSGDEEAASRLRSRLMGRITTPHGCWWFLLQVAQYGDEESTVRATAVLAPYERFPLARAHRLAIESRQASLRGDALGRTTRASEAADLFANLGWRPHQASCLKMAERPAEAQRVYRAMGAHGHYEGRPRVPSGAGRHRRHHLTVIEREVAQLVARGLTNSQIALRLGMAQRTVKYHLTIIFNHLGVQRRSAIAELVNDDPAVLDG